MSRKDLEIVIGSKDEYSAEFARAQSKLGGLSAGAMSSAAVFATLGLSIGGVVGFLKAAIDAANEQEAAEKKLAVALGYTSNALLAQANALQQTTTFGDEQIINAQALIAAYTKGEEQTRAVTEATLDLASAKDMDLASAAELVAKSLGSETNALARHGIAVHGAVGSTERLASLTKGIADLYSGQAAAAADTFGGKMTQLKNAIGEVTEAVGGHITKSSFFKSILEAEIRGLYDLAAIVSDIGKFTDETKVEAKVTALKQLIAEVAAIEDQRLRSPQKGLLAFFEVSESELEEKRAIIRQLKVEIAELDKSIAAAAAAKPKAAKPREAESEVATKKIEALELATRKLGATTGELTAIELEEFKTLTMNKAQIIDFTAALEAKRVKEAELAAQKERLAAGGEFRKLEKESPYKKELDELNNSYQDKIYAFQAYNTAIIQAMITGGAEQSEVQEYYAKLSIATDEKILQMKRKVWIEFGTEMTSALNELYRATGSHSKRMFDMMKALNLASALVEGSAAINKAFNKGFDETGSYWGATAYAIAAGIRVTANVETIRRQKYDSPSGGISSGAGGGVSSGGGGGGSGSIPIREGQAPVAPQQITVIVNNPISDGNWDALSENIVDAINRAAQRNVNVTVRAA